MCTNSNDKSSIIPIGKFQLSNNSFFNNSCKYFIKDRKPELCAGHQHKTGKYIACLADKDFKYISSLFKIKDCLYSFDYDSQVYTIRIADNSVDISAGRPAIDEDVQQELFNNHVNQWHGV